MGSHSLFQGIFPTQGLNPGHPVGKESACNAGDPSSIPGLGRSAGEGIGYSLQYSWASLVAELVKNPSAMRETWVQSLGRKDPLEEGMATHSSILAWRIPMDRGAWRATVHGVAKSWTQLSDYHFTSSSSQLTALTAKKQGSLKKQLCDKIISSSPA